MNKPTPYTEDELRQALLDRQGGFTLAQYSAEIGISAQYLSQILNGTRPVTNAKVLEFLAPRGMRYVRQHVWFLVSK